MDVGPHIMVLGPAKDHNGKDWPMEMRRTALRVLKARQSAGILMEAVPSLAGETPARKFERIVKDYNVKTFLVVWPKACRLHGLDVEFGLLLGKIMDGKVEARDVKLVTHAGNARIGFDGLWELGEKGNRTHYYESLLDEGCPVFLFETQGHFQLNINSAALDHHQRHIARVAEREFIGQTAVRLKAKSVSGPRER